METTIELFGNLYHLNDGKVVDVRNVREVPVYAMKEGSWFILLQKDGKPAKFNYGLFILYAFNRFFLPFEHWGKVTVGFLDDDNSNYNLDNLYVIYPENGIEHPEKPGYYYIPGFELNLINRKGCVYRILKNKLRIPKVSRENKYPVTIVCLNKKRYTSKLLHRMLALTFKNPPKGYPNLVVDHLNGRKYDFDLDNLEWVTSQENNTRAVKCGLKEDGTVILVKDKDTGVVSEYFSITEFARSLGVHPQYIVDGKTNANQTYKGRYVIKDLDDERDWGYFEAIRLIGKKMGVKARCIGTGEVRVFESTKQAGKKTGTHQNAIAQYFRNKSEPCIINGYEWKLEHDMSAWTDFNEYQLEIYRRGLHRNTRVYEVLDLETQVKAIHYGWKLISEFTGANKRTVIRIGLTGGVINNRYKLKVLN